MVTASFISEPRDAAYRDFVFAVSALADRFLLVVRTEYALDETGLDVLEQLSPWSRVVERRAEWPGTRLGGGATAEIHEYSVSEGAMAIVQGAVSALYDWQGSRPEDLSFLRADRSVLAYVIAHEEDGGVMLQAEERDRFVAAWPDYADYLKWD